MLGVGTKLGVYEIVAPLGAGGMGEVYRALDTHLGRTVAIKILPAEFASDTDHLRRFETEARSASALCHPNIVTIHELGQHGSCHYIVMELVEGRTLRELLAAGPLPIRRAIEIAAQVAEGLTKAHELGIAHRDLKPENLMVSEDGYAKILDFGLAKSAAPKKVSHSTTSVSHTPPGRVLGTLGYMSPEQACGEGLDYRSDQFSFGAVLYEMVTGKSAFQKKTAPETLLAILRDHPDPVATQNREAPAPLCWLIERCLSKDPEKRYAATRDLARELSAIRDNFWEKTAQIASLRRSNLPVQRTGFVGRDKEIAAVTDLLLDSSVPLVTITGPGGIGKSRLAVQVATGVMEHFPGGAHFVALHSLHDSALIPSAIIQTLGLKAAGNKPALEVLKENLTSPEQGATLLILDNFEHLTEAASLVSELLASTPTLKVLVTSRSALHVYGEHEFPVPPLELPGSKPENFSDVSHYPALALFVQRATAAKPDFELSRDNASAVIEICARLDGLPLAIELAAARVKVLSPASLLQRLANRLQVLTGGARDLPERQQTLRSAMDWSYDLLTEAEQKLFRRLSVFAGGCTLEGVEAVCDARGDLDIDLLDGMASIVDKSLVRQVERAGGESRFVMLETIREYALAKLEASGEEALTKRAHAAYCLVVAEELTQSEAPGEAWREQIAAENDNFRAALEWLTATAEADWGLRLGIALFRFWQTSEYLFEGRERLEKLLKLPKAAPPTKARARALFAAGVLASEQGDYISADPLMDESLKIATDLQDQQGVAVSQNAMGVIARDKGDLSLAQELFEKSLGNWQQIGERTGIARAMSNLANVAKLKGDYSRARALYAQALGIFEALGNREAVAWAMNYQGDIARDQGDASVSRTLYEQSLTLFRELGDQWGMASSLVDLGNLAREQGDFATAHKLYREGLEIFQDLDHKRGVARVLECFACAASEQCDAPRALRLAGAAAALRKRIGAPLAPIEKARLEPALDLARQTLGDSASTTAWLEGYGLPLEESLRQDLPQTGPGAIGNNVRAS